MMNGLNLGAIVTSLAVGAALGYAIATKKLEAKYEARAALEVHKAKDFYKALNKRTYPTAKDAEKALIEEKDVPKVVAQKIEEYSGEGEDTSEEDLGPRGPMFPYIITESEFSIQDPEFESASLTCYIEDDGEIIVVDDDQDPIDHEKILGVENLRFGVGSSSPHVVFIQNESMKMRFEVEKSSVSFTKDVLGA